MSALIRQCLDWPIVRRALFFAVIVGTILITINHGDAILAGDLDRRRLLKMALTVMVPYLVSTISSVAAMRQVTQQQVDRQSAEATRRAKPER